MTIDTAEELRLRGNELHKARKFDEAIVLYQQASDAAPHDASPLSNLSAAYYELGDYAASIAAGDKALDLLSDDAKKQKILLRKAKSLIYCRDYDRVFDVMGSLPPNEKTSNIGNAAVAGAQSCEDIKRDAIRTRLINELPRCKPQIRKIPEYFVVGHDVPESLHGQALLTTGRDKISFLLAGVGDARHLHATLIFLGMGSGPEQAEAKKSFHFTICDHKPAVIARDIIVLLMFERLSRFLDDEDNDNDNFILPNLYYLYLSPIIPKPSFDQLQETITSLLDMLEDREPLPSWLDVPPVYRPGIIRLLKEWQDEAGSEYPTARVRKEAVRNRTNERLQRESTRHMYGDNSDLEEHELHPVSQGLEKEEAFYRKTGVLLMHWIGHHQLHTEELRNAYDNLDPKDPDKLDTGFLETIDSTWQTNPTFIDLEWQRNREASHTDLSNVGHDPFGFSRHMEEIPFIPTKREGLLHVVATWFHVVASAFQDVKPRLKVEACVGDVAAVLEQIRYGAIGRRTATSTPLDVDGTQSADVENEAQYPHMYDRIHLSNIADYIGGTLPTFLYAVPVLYPDETSYVTANCLRNPPRFKNHDHFNNESLALSDPKAIEKVFHASMAKFPNPDAPLILTEYAQWRQQPVSKAFSNLMPRAQLETWLFRLFMKLAIPKEREMRTQTLIYSPLNMTVFVRLCGHLHNIGYPAHWLSGVLDEIVSGKITTSARPPRSEPLKMAEVKASLPVIEQSTTPFVAEMTTLLSLWRFWLPFGTLSHHIPDTHLIHKYEVTFSNMEDYIAESPSFVLVLLSINLIQREAGMTLGSYLLSDEKGSQDPEHVRAREEGLHVISTWNWNRAEKVATFWMRKDVIESMDRKEWGLAVWRTDSWIMQAGPKSLNTLRDMGPFLDAKDE